MNKKELIVAAAAASGLSQKDVEKALKAINEAIVAEVAKKGKVQLIGFGTFEARERAARTGKNPQTGAAIKIAAATVPAFKAGKAFKEAVNVKPAKKAKAKKRKNNLCSLDGLSVTQADRFSYVTGDNYASSR